MESSDWPTGRLRTCEAGQPEYKRRGYQEVISPNLCNIDLWKISGHYKNYKENLYLLKNQDGNRIETQGLKPMNCPGHCLIFKS